MTPEQQAAIERGLEALKQIAEAMPFPVGKQATTAMTAALAGNALAGKESVATGDTSSERVAKTPKKVHEKSVEWRGLTLEQKHQLNDALNLQGRFAVIDAIEAKLKELNT